jgi:SAM-dependent methyltransferase
VLPSRIESRLRPRPAARFVHPKARNRPSGSGEHDANLDVAEDSGPNYLGWIADMCRPFLGDRVLDVGAGTGSITARFAEGREVEAVELSDWCVHTLRERFAGLPSVTVRQANLFDLSAGCRRFDSAVLINVLEHIEDDVAALQTVSSLVRPGGRIVIYVPALNALYGAWDSKVGHVRRYAPWRLREVLAAAGLSPLIVRYVNALAIPAWFVFSHMNVDKRHGERLGLWDRTGVPLTRAIESRVRIPFGLNVFCVAEVSW